MTAFICDSQGTDVMEELSFPFETHPISLTNKTGRTPFAKKTQR